MQVGGGAKMSRVLSAKPIGQHPRHDRERDRRAEDAHELQAHVAEDGANQPNEAECSRAAEPVAEGPRAATRASVLARSAIGRYTRPTPIRIPIPRGILDG